MKNSVPEGMTPDQFIDRWRRALMPTWKQMLADAHPDHEHSKNDSLRRQATSTLNKIALKMERDRDWRWRVPGRSSRVSELATANQGSLAFHYASMYRVLRLTHAVASGEGFAATPADEALLKSILGDHPLFKNAIKTISIARTNRVATLAPGESTLADVAFLWRRPSSNGKESMELARATTRVAIEGVSTEDAPVEMQIRTPEGNWFDVRSIAGVLYRPLMAPGEWRPIPLAECLDALASGRAWVDSPALTPEHVSRHMDLDDLASESAPPRELAKAETEAERVRACCVGLVCIDGVVHRPTEAPKIGISLKSNYDLASPSVIWSLGSLASDVSQNPSAIHNSRTANFAHASWHREPESTLAFDPGYDGFVRGVVAKWMEYRREPREIDPPWFQGIEAASPADVAAESARLIQLMPKDPFPAKDKLPVRKPANDMLAKMDMTTSPETIANAFSKASIAVVERVRENRPNNDCLCAALLAESAEALRRMSLDHEMDEDGIASAFSP